MTLQAEKVCCFTGHRPDKIKGTENEIRKKLKAEITKVVQDGFRGFITGMAPGVDIWAATEVLEIKKQIPDIQLICAIPFMGVEGNRTPEEKAEYYHILNAADTVEYICKDQHRWWSFPARDRWMVDHSQRVIAVFNGTPGGTAYTLDYARKKNIEIILIEDRETD